MKEYFALDCGRRVSVDALYFQRTYISLLAGRAQQYLNEKIIERAKAKARALWGVRRVYVVPPAIDQSDPAHPVLPPAFFAAWLVCNEPINPGNAGSELVATYPAPKPVSDNQGGLGSSSRRRGTKATMDTGLQDLTSMRVRIAMHKPKTVEILYTGSPGLSLGPCFL